MPFCRWSFSCCSLMIMILWWGVVYSSSDLLVKSCIRVRSIQNLENKGKSTVYIKIWRDNDDWTAQQTSTKSYNSATIDFSSESPICWSFSTSGTTNLMWRPNYAIKATIQVNGDEKQGLLLVSFPYNITSVFQSYTNKALTRVSTGTITFDIYHTFSGSWMKISNRNFMVYKTCYKLWSVCVESPKQGNHSQCISNAVSSTSPTGGQTALNDQNSDTVWSPASSSSSIPDKCWQPYSQYVKINIANSFGLIRIGFAQFNGFSSRSWQSSDTKPGKYFSFSFTNDTTDEIQNWQYWYADLSDNTSFSQDITSPADSNYPYYIINPLFLRKDVNPYPAGKNRLTEVISGFNEYWVVNTNLSYNANYGVFTTWGSLLVISSASNDNTASKGRAIGTTTCNSLLTGTGVFVKQLASTTSQRCYDTGVADQCTGPVYYPPMALAYIDGSVQVSCGSNEDLKNCTGISSCVTSTLGANQWCDNAAIRADDYRPIYIECKAPTQVYTISPSKSPTFSPTPKPTLHPNKHPTGSPTESPTQHPTKAPTPRPTKRPTLRPTLRPTGRPSTISPTEVPTIVTKMPTLPTSIPSQFPTTAPTVLSTGAPTTLPTSRPTHIPTRPTSPPTSAPTSLPTPNPAASKPTLNPNTLSTTTEDPEDEGAKRSGQTLSESTLITIVSVLAALTFIIFLITCLLYFMWKKQQKKKQNEMANESVISSRHGGQLNLSSIRSNNKLENQSKNAPQDITLEGFYKTGNETLSGMNGSIQLQNQSQPQSRLQSRLQSQSHPQLQSQPQPQPQPQPQIRSQSQFQPQPQPKEGEQHATGNEVAKQEERQIKQAVKQSEFFEKDRIFGKDLQNLAVANQIMEEEIFEDIDNPNLPENYNAAGAGDDSISYPLTDMRTVTIQ